MRDDIRSDVLRQLKADYGFKAVGSWLRQGKCPQCGARELFISAETPWVVKCGRENRCAWSASTKDLYPDLFGKFNERYPATTQDPNATADAYMSFVRCFDISKIKGWYRQGHFTHPGGDRATATVVFDVDRANNVLMERLVETVRVTDRKTGEVSVRKANFEGQHKGMWWAPPGMTINKGDTVWLVEGCLDAIALNLHGVKAVATLSSANYPAKALGSLHTKDITLVWAMDNDPAGRRAIRKFAELAHQDGFESRAALIPQKGRAKTDWNDLHIAGELEPQHLERYRFHGDLLMAKSATEKALLIWERHGSTSFAVEFGSRTYWFELPKEVYELNLKTIMEHGQSHPELTPEQEAARKSARISTIANCKFEFLYFQKQELTDESWYYTRIEFPHGRHKIKNTFTGAQIATASEFKKRLLSIAPGALFTGNTQQLNWLVRHHLDDIKIVETIDFIGYSKQHKAWIFPTVAVSGGQAYELNDEDFFEINRLSIKSLTAIDLRIGKATDYQSDWVQHVRTAYGPQGLIAVAFLLGSLFAEQIREMHQSYPFLEIVGEANAGKTTLIEFLFKLVGRVGYEGFDPNKATLAARGRNLSQVSNLPVSLIESDRENDTAKARQFDWDELKTAFNGRASRSLGVKNMGNDTYEPPFRGSIMISQNAAVKASDAIMQRIVHLYFDTSTHSPAGYLAATAMSGYAGEALSYFLVLATKAERAILDTVKRLTPVFEAELMALPDIRTRRIALNHGQLMALVSALADLVKMPTAWRDEAHAALRRAAVERQVAIASDHAVVEEFWDLVDFLGEGRVNHTRDPDRIAVNLNHFAKLAAMNNQTIPSLQDLKKHLKTSRTRRFIESNKTVNSAIEGFTSVKCWIFARGPK